MIFKKYQHVERFGEEEVAGIEQGACYVFPKLDGFNCSCWLGDDKKVHVGTRYGELFPGIDKGKYYNMLANDNNIISYLTANPTHRLFGEFLEKHCVKTYSHDAWNKFYIFDVCTDTNNADFNAEKYNYIPYDLYSLELSKFNIEYIPAITTISDGTYEEFVSTLGMSTYLIGENLGCGEGIVIKNYDFKNRYGRTTWAKILMSEIDKTYHKKMNKLVPYSPTVKAGEASVEERIIYDYVTEAYITKEYYKIFNSISTWNENTNNRLISTVFSTLIKEEMWHICKKYNYPKINFGILNELTTEKVKDIMSELFSQE